MHKDLPIRNQQIKGLLSQGENILSEMQQQDQTSVKFVMLMFQVLEIKRNSKEETILAEMRHQGFIAEDSAEVLLVCPTIQELIKYLKYLEVPYG